MNFPPGQFVALVLIGVGAVHLAMSAIFAGGFGLAARSRDRAQDAALLASAPSLICLGMCAIGLTGAERMPPPTRELMETLALGSVPLALAGCMVLGIATLWLPQRREPWEDVP